MGIGITLSINSETGKIESTISNNFFPAKTVREHKGKSIISFPENYCIIDIETTGLSPAYDSIIEISSLKISNDKIIDTFSSLVQPYSIDGEYIDSYIEELTGITNEMLSTAPLEKDVLPLFKNFIGDSILVGHNVHFDINFLYDSFINRLDTPLCNDFIDTMRISKRLHRELSHHRLSDIALLYGIDYSSAHRSLVDCNITFECYLKMKSEIVTKYSTLSDFINELKRGVRSKDIHATTDSFDESNPLYGKVVVFTGVLEKMTRKEAMQVVSDCGGINSDSVTAKTNYLVLGNNDYCKSIKDGKSNKHKKAEQLKLKGNDIEILPESAFYDMLND